MRGEQKSDITNQRLGEHRRGIKKKKKELQKNYNYNNNKKRAKKKDLKRL